MRAAQTKTPSDEPGVLFSTVECFLRKGQHGNDSSSSHSAKLRAFHAANVFLQLLFQRV